MPCNSRGGVSKLSEYRKISLLNSSVALITVSVLSGTPCTGSASQLPGVTTCTRLATSTRVTTTNRSRVHAYCPSEVCASGSKTTRSSAVPARN